VRGTSRAPGALSAVSNAVFTFAKPTRSPASPVWECRRRPPHPFARHSPRGSRQRAWSILSSKARWVRTPTFVEHPHYHPVEMRTTDVCHHFSATADPRLVDASPVFPDERVDGSRHRYPLRCACSRKAAALSSACSRSPAAPLTTPSRQPSNVRYVRQLTPRTVFANAP